MGSETSETTNQSIRHSFPTIHSARSAGRAIRESLLPSKVRDMLQKLCAGQKNAHMIIAIVDTMVRVSIPGIYLGYIWKSNDDLQRLGEEQGRSISMFEVHDEDIDNRDVGLLSVSAKVLLFLTAALVLSAFCVSAITVWTQMCANRRHPRAESTEKTIVLEELHAQGTSTRAESTENSGSSVHADGRKVKRYTL